MFVTAPSGASNRKGNEMNKTDATIPDANGSRILEIRECALDHACRIWGWQGPRISVEEANADTIVKAAGKFEAYLRSGV